MRQRHASRNYNFSGLNVPPDRIPQRSDAFSLTAQPRTDLWRRTAAARQRQGGDTLTAPALITTLRFPFVSAEVTVAAPWSLEWDQAGLVIFLGDPESAQRSYTRASELSQTTTTTATSQVSNILDPPPAYHDSSSSSIKWAKVGLELIHDTVHASSAVTTSYGTDWSCTTAGLSPAQQLQNNAELRIKMERIGPALWLSYQERGITGSVGPRWRKFREITDFFVGVEHKEVRVGVYASRPAGLHASACMNVERDLTVEFEDLVIF